MPFIEGEYDPRVLRRNRATIIVAALGGSIALVVASALSEWPMSNALGLAALWLLACAALWWLFGTRGSGPLRLSDRSQGWFKSAAAPYGRRRSSSSSSSSS